MSIQNNTAVDVYQNFVLPTALDSDFSSEDLADDTASKILAVFSDFQLAVGAYFVTTVTPVSVTAPSAVPPCSAATAALTPS